MKKIFRINSHSPFMLESIFDSRRNNVIGVQNERKTSHSLEIDVNFFREEPNSSERTGRPVTVKPVHETSVIQKRSSEDRKDFNVEQAHERTGRLVLTHDVIHVSDSSQTRSARESETFNVGDETLRERSERPVLGIFSHTPEAHVAFCPIFVHPLFPVFEPIFKNGSFLSVVALVSVTLVDSNPRPSSEKDRIWHRLPPPPSRRLRQLNFPNVKNDAGQKQCSPCFLRRRRQPKAGDAFTRTRLVPTFGVSAALPAIGRQCSAERPAEGPKVFRVFGVFRVFRVVQGWGYSGCSELMVWGVKGLGCVGCLGLVV